MKRIYALIMAIRARNAPAPAITGSFEFCMAIEREYALLPYPFEWE